MPTDADARTLRIMTEYCALDAAHGRDESKVLMAAASDALEELDPAKMHEITWTILEAIDDARVARTSAQVAEIIGNSKAGAFMRKASRPAAGGAG